MSESPTVDNLPEPGHEGFLEAIAQLATRPAERALSTRLALGRDYQLMIFREDPETIHVYTIGDEAATRNAFLALVSQMGPAGCQYEVWNALDYGHRRHVRFEAPS